MPRTRPAGCQRLGRAGAAFEAASESGMALITVVLVTMLAAALMVGFVSAIASDLKSSGLDRDQTQAYAAAHAGLEKLTSDLSALFRSDFSPSAPQIDAVAAAGNRPVIAGFEYVAPDGTSGYRITWPYADAGGNPAPESTTGSAIAAGPYQGFMGIITPYNLTVTARSRGGAEVRLRRTLQTVGIPVFQFGMFSETDLAFHAGDTFNFGGRVHTNANLYLAQADGSTLTFADRITAFGHVIRTHLPNDLPVTSGYNGTVLVPKVIKTPNNTNEPLLRTQGSLIGDIGLPSSSPTSPFWTRLNSGWTAISTGTYKSIIRSGGASAADDPPFSVARPNGTGARRLDLPLVADTNGDGEPDAEPIELIRRPPPADLAHVLEQRYFWQASLRILLSDEAADIQNLATVTQGTAPVQLTEVALNERHYIPVGATPTADHPPLAESGGPAYVLNNLPPNTYLSGLGESLLGGFIKIEMKRQDNTWVDVTRELLALGISGRNLASTNTSIFPIGPTRWNSVPATAADACGEPNPNAVIRLQRVRDLPALHQPCGFTGATVSPLATDYWPNVLYDTREGDTRDGVSGNILRLGGVVHYVELDVNNLRRWLLGQIGSSGTQARNDNGFIVYFSDRRNNNTDPGNETGEYGYEDTVNPATPAGTPNGGAPDAGEDANRNGLLETYGATAKLANVPFLPLPPLVPGAHVYHTQFDAPNWGIGAAEIRHRALQARANKAIVFRRALKIVNGGISGGVNNIIAPGLTVASENPVYIQGNYNATSTSATAEPNVASAVIADAVTLLSNNWSDVRSFLSSTDSNPSSPTALNPGRPAGTTGFRLAIVTGKTRAFPKPAFASQSFGSDGGAHNFVRLLENWSNGSVLRYRGSFVSFYFSRQATGSFKCCQADTYIRGTRDWTFDQDFLLPALLPPGTPMFRDVNTLTFRQILRPNQD